MSRIKKSVWALTLCFFLSGCTSAYQPAVMPGEIRNDSTSAQMSALRKGDAVRVTLHSGEQATGNVYEIGIDILTLGEKGFLVKKRDIGVAEIEKIEIKESTGDLSTAGAVIIGVLVVGVVVGLIALASSPIADN